MEIDLIENFSITALHRMSFVIKFAFELDVILIKKKSNQSKIEKTLLKTFGSKSRAKFEQIKIH